jgi:hypothetical protein
MNSSTNSGIIVLGVPRSGTTLLRRLLNWHPEVYCGGENFLLTAASRFLRSDSIVDGIDYGVLGGLAAEGIPPQELLGDLRDLVSKYLERAARAAGKSRWASKTAIDSFYVSEIEQLFACHARFVCVVRHGLDVALSLRDLCDANEIYLREIHDYIVRHPRPLVAFAHLWSDVTASLLDLANRRPDSAVVVRYEDLVHDPESQIARLTSFLELEPDHNLLQALTSDQPKGLGDWKTYEKTTVEDSSVDRWADLSEATVSRLAPIVNRVLEQAGYPRVKSGAIPEPEQAMRRYELSLSLQASRSRSQRDD